MKRWSSPLLSPVAFDDEARKQVAVVVPCSGWFAFCFGTSEEERIFCQNYPGVARIQSPDGTLSTTLDLPMLDSNSEALSSIHVGKLLYLVKDSVFSVLYESSRLTSTCDNGEIALPLKVHWQLVLQRSSQDGKQVFKNPIFCVACRRLFGTRASVEKHIMDTHSTKPEWSKTPLKVLYQDDVCAVVDKPQGVAVMGTKPCLSKSNLFVPLASTRKGALRKPIAAHRLDAGTGGLLVLAKTKAAEASLKQSFENRACQKRYLALVHGRLEPGEGVIEKLLSGKPAVTRYRVVKYTRCPTSEWVTTVDLYPETGRTHQLRKHLKHLGFPIWGDLRYGPQLFDTAIEDQISSTSPTVEQVPNARMCLWAMEISFPHPETGVETRVSLKEDPPWLTSLVQHLEEQSDLSTQGDDS